MIRDATLVIDTVGPWCACAVRVGGHVFATAETLGRGHAERLAPMVRALLEEARLSPPRLARIGVNTGPGSFAGTRVGVSFARGLALASGAQAIGVDLLSALARRCDPEGVAIVMAVHDAGRGDLLWRLFDGGDCLSGLKRGDVDAAKAAADARPGAILAGSGAVRLGADPLRIDLTPPLVALLDLSDAAAPDAPSPAPVYARPPDAKLPGGLDPELPPSGDA